MPFAKMSTDEKFKEPLTIPGSIPQPHFIPGYTGFCPGLSNRVGATYGRATNEILKQRPEIAGRLKSLEPSSALPKKLHEAEEEGKRQDQQLISSRLPKSGKKVFNDYVVSGYGGHVPNMANTVGVSYNDAYVKSVSKFIRDHSKDSKSL